MSINKHKIYLEMAQVISKLSKDRSTKVGCCSVDVDGILISVGYNGFVSKADDSEIDYTGKPFEYYLENFDKYVANGIFDDSIYENKYTETTKNHFMLHAEQNMILHTDDRKRLKGSSVYITHYPCNICSLMLAQSKVKNIYCLDNKTKSFDSYIKDSLYILECSGININIINNLD